MIDFIIEFLHTEYYDYMQRQFPRNHYDKCCCGFGPTEKAAFGDCLDALARCITLNEKTRLDIQIEYDKIAGSGKMCEHGYYYVKIQWSES